MNHIHDELGAVVVEIKPWGFNVRSLDGRIGYVDNTKNPRWVAGEEGPKIGDVVHLVIIDTDQDPFRASALERDIEIGRESR